MVWSDCPVSFSSRLQIVPALLPEFHPDRLESSRRPSAIYRGAAAPCLNEKLDAVASILCRGNAYKEIPHIVSANLYLIDAGLCHPVDNLD
jgi:hypothetical protein